MAVVSFCGFEGQASSIDSSSAFTGSAAYNTSIVRTGAASCRVNPGSGASGQFLPGFITSSYVHFAMYVASLPSVTRLIAGVIAANNVNLRLTSTGTIEIYNNTTLLGTSSAKFATPGWHFIGFLNKSATAEPVLMIDGEVEVTATTTLSAINPRFGALGTEASAVDLYLDDIVIDDAGFLPNAKVDIALPISDNTVTGVTDNNGVTTDIWQCVDNTPPAGVASANEAANAKAGMHFPASTTCDYIANLETYSTLGVNPGDAIIAVRSIVRHGEDISPGTKNLQNVGALTNPTVAGTNASAGNDGGAHGAEVGLWITSFGVVQSNPTGITLGTSPTIRTSRTSQSRVACADFMGMDVVWVPDATPPKVDVYPQLLPQ